MSFVVNAVYIAALYALLLLLTAFSLSWLGVLLAPLLGLVVLAMALHYVVRTGGGLTGLFLLAPSVFIAAQGWRVLKEVRLLFTGDWNAWWMLPWLLFVLPPFVKPLLQPSYRWIGPLSLHGLAVLVLHLVVASMFIYEGWRALQDPPKSRVDASHSHRHQG